jgi:hypothetical protein
MSIFDNCFNINKLRFNLCTFNTRLLNQCVYYFAYLWVRLTRREHECDEQK